MIFECIFRAKPNGDLWLRKLHGTKRIVINELIDSKVKIQVSSMQRSIYFLIYFLMPQ